VSHGELVRDGVDQTLCIDPAKLRFVFQGMLEREKSGKDYGHFPWRIGMLTPATHAGRR
jgi:endo-1,4-beta-xylanase